MGTNKEWKIRFTPLEGFLYKQDENWNTRSMLESSTNVLRTNSTNPSTIRRLIDRQYNTWLEGIGHPLFI